MTDSNAPQSAIEKALSDIFGSRFELSMLTKRKPKKELIKIKIDALRKRQIERITRGRTKGAGAGGFNRDVDSITHQIKLLEHELECLDSHTHSKFKLV